MAKLSLKKVIRGPKVLLSPHGWMDLSNVASLLEEIRSTLTSGATPGPLAVNLSATEYIDSAAVSALIQAKSQAEESGTWLALVALSPQVERVLRETRLIDIFPVYQDSEAFFAETQSPNPKD